MFVHIIYLVFKEKLNISGFLVTLTRDPPPFFYWVIAKLEIIWSRMFFLLVFFRLDLVSLSPFPPTQGPGSFHFLK